MIMALIIIVILLLLLAGVSIFYVIKFGTIIINMQDSIEQALDVLDERYHSINDIIQTPLFYDSPEIRKVLRDINITRDSMLDIAKSLTSLDEIGLEHGLSDEDQA